MIAYSEDQISTAIELEVLGWVKFFNITDLSNESLNQRRRFHRANLRIGHYGELATYLPLSTTQTLKERLDGEEVVRCKDKDGTVIARACRLGVNYVMRSAKGDEHRLHVNHTDNERLVAHWRGFCETSTALHENRVYRHQA
jgi:hypothetical protein